MIEIRFHGRGGQGAVIASNMLAEAAFSEGRHVQSFPHFGVERRGAPVAAFARISDAYIRRRHRIHNPDCVVVLDPTLIDTVDVISGLKERGLILINSDKPPGNFNFKNRFRVATVNASEIARQNGLGGKAAPIVNTAMLGALSRFTKFIKIESIFGAIKESAPLKKEENLNAAKEAYEKVRF